MTKTGVTVKALLLSLFITILITGCPREFLDPLDPESTNYQGYPVYEEDDIPPDAVLALSGVQPGNGSSITDTTPRLEWTAVPNASSYQLQISASETGISEAPIIPTAEPSYQIPLSEKRAYRDICYWRVRAVSGENKYSPWSEIQIFSVDWDIPWTGLVPGNNSTSIDTTPLLQWETVPLAAAYQIRYADSSAGLSAAALIDATTPEYEITDPQAMNTVIFWQVRGINEDEVPSDWSGIFQFTISMDITWAGISPAHQSTTSDTTPLLSWSGVGGIESYQVRYSSNSNDFTGATEYDSAAAEYQIDIVQPLGTVVYWQVRGINEDGVPTDWSPIYSFTIEWNVTWSGISPSDGGTTADTTPLLQWDDVPLASGYEVEFSLNIENLEGNDVRLTELSEYQLLQEDNLNYGDTVFWRIRAVNEDNVKSEWSSINSLLIRNNSKSIVSFTFADPEATGLINEETKTITITVPYGTDVTTLVPTIIHTGESISPAAGSAQNFANPISYTITAEDGSIQEYIVSVMIAPDLTKKAITAFSFISPETSGSIDESAKTIAVTVPYGTDITSLVPTITHTGTSISPTSGTAHNFTNPIVYTVTAEDGSTQEYIVSVTIALNPAKSITSFSFTNPAATGSINESGMTIAVTVPYGTDVTALVPTITHTGASISPTSETAQNFTNPVTYTVTAQDGSTQYYSVVVNLAQPVAGSKVSYDVPNIYFNMVYVPAKSFYTEIDDSGTAAVENPFWMAETEVTYELWYAVRSWAESNGYTFANPGREGSSGIDDAAPTADRYEPVTNISWRDVIVWCNALTEWYNYQTDYSYTCTYFTDLGYTNPIKVATDSEIITYSIDGSQDAPHVKADSTGFRLPISKEWELSARYIDDANDDGDIMDEGEYYPGNYASGANANYYNETETGLVAWYSANAGNTTHPVKEKNTNALGLYDMNGNVWELCFDWYPGYEGYYRIQRGGGWGSVGNALSTGHFEYTSPYRKASDDGFRFLRMADY